MFKIKKFAAMLVAVVCISSFNVVVCADEPVTTEFDWSKIAGIFESEDSANADDNVNIIGETGVVQGGQTQTSVNNISVKTVSTADLSLIANQSFEVSLYSGGTAVAVQRIPISGGSIETEGLGDGTYTYKINGAEDVLSFESVEGTCTVTNGIGTIRVSAEPVSVLYIVDSTGVSEYEFAQTDGVFSTDTMTNGFAVQAGMRYKVRKKGSSEYFNIEIPAMSLEYTYDIATNKSNEVVNEKAQQDAELPADVQSADNPYNIPPTMDKGTTNDYFTCISSGLVIAAAIWVLAIIIKRKHEENE